MEVSRGSQFQKEPQVDFANIEPEMVAKIANKRPNRDAIDALTS